MSFEIKFNNDLKKRPNNFFKNHKKTQKNKKDNELENDKKNYDSTKNNKIEWNLYNDFWKNTENENYFVDNKKKYKFKKYNEFDLNNNEYLNKKSNDPTKNIDFFGEDNLIDINEKTPNHKEELVDDEMEDDYYLKKNDYMDTNEE